MNARGKINFGNYFPPDSKMISHSYHVCIMGGTPKVHIGADSSPTFHIYIIDGVCTQENVICCEIPSSANFPSPTVVSPVVKFNRLT